MMKKSIQTKIKRLIQEAIIQQIQKEFKEPATFILLDDEVWVTTFEDNLEHWRFRVTFDYNVQFQLHIVAGISAETFELTRLEILTPDYLEKQNKK